MASWSMREELLTRECPGDGTAQLSRDEMSHRLEAFKTKNVQSCAPCTMRRNLDMISMSVGGLKQRTGFFFWKYPFTCMSENVRLEAEGPGAKSQQWFSLARRGPDQSSNLGHREKGWISERGVKVELRALGDRLNVGLREEQ